MNILERLFIRKKVIILVQKGTRINREKITKDVEVWFTEIPPDNIRIIEL